MSKGLKVYIDAQIAASNLRSRYSLFSLKRVHMATEAATGLSPLGVGASQVAADTRYGAIRALLILHFGHSGAAEDVDAVHEAADTNNGPAMALSPNGTEGRLVSCMGQMVGAISGHGAAAGAHGNAIGGNQDAVLAAFTYTTPVTDLPTAVAGLDEALAAIEAHFLRSTS